MSFSTLCLGVRDQELQSKNHLPSTAFSSHSSLTDCPTCTGPGLDVEISSIDQTVSEYTACLSESDSGECCRLPANADERLCLSECIDLGCAATICDECSNHEDCCGDCGMDCESDCEISFGCDDFGVGVDDTYSLEDSHSELFGDQTAQTFGFGRSLPHLALENSTTESGNFGRKAHDTTLSTLPTCCMDQDYSGSSLLPVSSFQTSCATPTPFSSPQVIISSRTSYGSAFQVPSNYSLTPTDIPPLARDSASRIYSSHSAHEYPDSIDFTPSAHYDHINLVSEKSDSSGRIPPSLQCQWADSNGEPCGETLGLGNNMHEHLKSAHGVKSEVFCRWVGCSVGVLKPSPHRFASSVERHTWGHSGYRPYRCSACNEGFAAASVRDEHFTNIHLRKKVFSCDMCSHQCTSATNLKRHKDDKHSAERFQCEFCNRYGKRRLFPRGPNLARHFRNCKYVQAQFPDAAAAGKAKADWLPPGYKRGHHGMDRARVKPPNYLPAQTDA